uniref:Uncharacterized protein n=1 Tax=Sinocyclocheilus rhinocerous TaxID=307959 RepID=A0A673KT20_9TELE
MCCFLIADELVKELNSSVVSRQEKAVAKEDQFISSLEQKEPCKTKINKTVMNKNPSSENGPVVQEQGNEAFTQGDYETAVRFYTEGLEQLRDMQALYTNRAQVLPRFRTSSCTII